MARKHEFSVDMHVHSMYSGESMAEPRDIIDAAREKGLDAICITEHESLRASAPFEGLRKAARLVVLRGVELSTDSGHMLVYGVDDDEWADWGKDKICHAQELIARVKQMGGLVVPAHPYLIAGSNGGSPYWWDPVITVDERVKTLTGLGALEVCNGKHMKYPSICEALGVLARKMGLPGIGGSDAHVPEDVGRSYTVFRTPVNTKEDLVRAIRAGCIHPQNSAEVCCDEKTAHISARGRAQISIRSEFTLRP